MMRSLSFRAKLTLWYLAVTSVALLLFGMLSFGALRYSLLQSKRLTLMQRERRLLLFVEQNEREHKISSLTELLRNYAVIAHEGNLVQIRDIHGKLIFPLETANASWLSHIAKDCAKPQFGDTILDGQPATIMCHNTMLDGSPVRIYVGGALEENLHILDLYRKALLLLLPCLLGIAAVSGYFLSSRAMRPVDRLTKAAVDIGIGNLSARLPLPLARDELWSLANTWNQLLDRLEGAVTRLSKFSADASHDLRTSITVILATAQVSLNPRRSDKEVRDNLDRIVNECRTASTLLDALLSLARSTNFVHEVAFQRINVSDLIVAGCLRVEGLAESSGLVMDWKLPEKDLFVEGDELLLQRLLGILLDNAIKFTPEDGEISVEAHETESGVLVIVRDTGIGISEDIRRNIFDRFYQADLRDRKDKAGSGLGLAIARWIADAHRAELAVESTPTKGSEFQIWFPASTSWHSNPATPPEHSVSTSEDSASLESVAVREGHRAIRQVVVTQPLNKPSTFSMQ
jgi:two-component system, OmpR family, heavy metal sensor histidine kinase CusS